MIAYFNGQYVSKENVKISPDDRGFLFGDGVYEVIRSYGGRLFKIDDHLSRLSHSLGELRMGPPKLFLFGTASSPKDHTPVSVPYSTVRSSHTRPTITSFPESPGALCWTCALPWAYLSENLRSLNGR